MSAGISLGTIASVVGIAGGVNSLMNSGTSPQGATAAADPFAPNRGQYADKLNALMADPSSVNKLPGWQAIQDQGIQTVERGLAAKGQASSGNEQIALQEQGRGQQSSFFNTYLQQLMNLSGANQNPSAGPQAASQALQNQQGVIGGIGQAFSGLQGMFGSGSTSNSNFTASNISSANNSADPTATFNFMANG